MVSWPPAVGGAQFAAVNNGCSEPSLISFKPSSGSQTLRVSQWVGHVTTNVLAPCTGDTTLSLPGLLTEENTFFSAKT